MLLYTRYPLYFSSECQNVDNDASDTLSALRGLGRVGGGTGQGLQRHLGSRDRVQHLLHRLAVGNVRWWVGAEWKLRRHVWEL